MIMSLKEERQSFIDLSKNNTDELIKRGVKRNKFKFVPTPTFKHNGNIYSVISYEYNDFINKYLNIINDSDLTVFFLADKNDEYHFEVNTEIVRFYMFKDNSYIKFQTMDEFMH